MDERIKEHLQHLNKYYLLLLKSRKVPYEKFTGNPIHHGSTERFLQNNLDDFKLFQKNVVDFLNKNKLPKI